MRRDLSRNRTHGSSATRICIPWTLDRLSDSGSLYLCINRFRMYGELPKPPDSTRYFYQTDGSIFSQFRVDDRILSGRVGISRTSDECDRQEDHRFHQPCDRRLVGSPTWNWLRLIQRSTLDRLPIIPCNPYLTVVYFCFGKIQIGVHVGNVKL